MLFRVLNSLEPETPQAGLRQTVKTQMKCRIMRHSIRVCTVCQDKSIVKERKAIFFWKSLPVTPKYVQFSILTSLYQTLRKIPLALKGLNIGMHIKINTKHNWSKNGNSKQRTNNIISAFNFVPEVLGQRDLCCL